MSVELIVVGVDNSPGSCTAVRWAAELAASLGARVIAVHAFEPLDHLDEISPGTDFAAVRDEIEHQLRTDWCRPLTAVDIEIETVIKEGRPADVILAVAREVDADLIVLGARRMGWLRELTLGSTSKRVLNEVHRPVTIIYSKDE